MSTPLDLDQLQTFIAIADAGSFTRAADAVFKTQSAVSMQMRRLEERIGKPLFERDGRINRLTEEGERLLLYARRMMQLNGETIAAFDDTQLEGHVRIGTPDDYADRFLPEIMARFARSNPRVELSVVCEPTVNLDEMIRRGTLDIALVTQCDDKRRSEVVRTEPLLWVTSANHAVHEEAVLASCSHRFAGSGQTRLSHHHHKLVSDRSGGGGSLRPCGLSSSGMCTASRYAGPW